MTTAAVATATSPLWFATRATGLTALVLLTGTVVLGILTSVRFASPAWPRFATVWLHRNLSLLTITFTGLHVLTTVTDPFASISVVSVVVPFSSAYRRIWLGLGAVAFDLLLAVLVTSLLRTRISPRVWRAVHWAGYACWPVALVHGLGTGTDGAARWVLAVSAACALAVAATGIWRLVAGWPAHAGVRVAAAVAAAAVALTTAAWAWAGPLSPGWARRAGTPAALLARSAGNSGTAAAAGSATSSSGGSGGTGTRSGSSVFPAVPFTAQLSGTVAFGPAAASGDRTVTLALGGGNAVRLKIVISGPAVAGGVEMAASSVSLGPAAAPARYTGRLVALQGTAMQAVVSAAGVSGADHRLVLAIQLTSQTSTAVTGTVTAQRAGEGE
jgi:sulfoxide reductase heme-binding subunit YedZ